MVEVFVPHPQATKQGDKPRRPASGHASQEADTGGAMGRGKRVESMLSSLPEPSDTQRIVVVTGLPGGNLLQVEDADANAFLCRVPSKFRNRVWVIKGGYLIVEMDQPRGAEGAEDLGKVQGTLAHHLYRDQIKHLRSRSLWPASFDQSADSATDAGEGAFDDDDDDDGGYGALSGLDLHENTNRRALSESEEESEDEDEDEEEDEEDAATQVAPSQVQTSAAGAVGGAGVDART